MDTPAPLQLAPLGGVTEPMLTSIDPPLEEGIDMPDEPAVMDRPDVEDPAEAACFFSLACEAVIWFCMLVMADRMPGMAWSSIASTAISYCS